MAKKKERFILIDIEPMIYQLVTNGDHLTEQHNEDDEYWEILNMKTAKEELETRISETAAILSAKDNIIVCYGGRENFRKRLLPEYKGNRGKKPLGFRALIEWASDKWESATAPEMEADDIIGILHTSDIIKGYETVVVSIDKDLKTLPGLLFNPDKAENNKPLLISEQEAIEFWCIQSLAGDTADGYKGCPGIGVVKAKKLIDKALEEWNKKEDLSSYLFDKVIAVAYADKEIPIKDALVQCQVARILRKGEAVINDEIWEPKPWLPNSMAEKSSSKRKSNPSVKKGSKRVRKLANNKSATNKKTAKKSAKPRVKRAAKRS